MCAPPVHHRLPRAGVDRIGSPETAIITLAMAIHRPLRAETITLLLDHERRGVAVAVVTDTRQPDAVLEVVECLTRTSAHGGRVGAVIVATVRPGAADPVVLAGDVDRWLEMSDIAEQAGVELVEWFVIGPEITCPRDLLGEAPRW
jgi:hypothetical protein